MVRMTSHGYSLLYDLMITNRKHKILRGWKVKGFQKHISAYREQTRGCQGGVGWGREGLGVCY